MPSNKLESQLQFIKNSPKYPFPLQPSKISSPTSSKNLNIVIQINHLLSLKMSNATQSMNPDYSKSTKDSNYGIILYIAFIIIIVIISFFSVIWKRMQLSSRLASWLRGETNHDHDQHVFISSDLEQDSITAMENGVNETTLDEYYPKFLCSEAHNVVYGDKVGLPIASSCCSICLGEYKDDEMMRLLFGCGHFFHQKCIDPWLTRHSTCPVCRSYSVPNTPEQQPAPLSGTGS